VQEGNYLIASVMIESALNSNCTATVGVPYACCTLGVAGTGTCQNAASATITTPSGKNGENWTQIDSFATSGSDFQMALYGRFVAFLASDCTGPQTPAQCCTGPSTGPTCVGTGNDLSSDQYTWGFSSNTYIGQVGITLYSGVGATPVENVGHTSTAASVTISEPAVTVTKANSLGVIYTGIVGNNSISSGPSGYSLVYDHSIAGSGPDDSNWVELGVSSSLLANSATAANSGDNVGFQLVLSPLP